MKKVIPLLLVTILLSSLLLSGCGNKPAPAVSSSAPPPSGSVPAAPATGSEPPKEWTPERAINIIVPYTAGGSSDLLGRAIEKVWSKYCEQPVQIVNKPGGGGVTGSVYVANSPPDGYTLGLAYGSGCDMSMPFLQELEYDPFEALDPLCLISIHTVMVGVPENSEFNSLADMIKWSDETGKPITAASSTANGTVDLVLQGLAYSTGANIVIIPHDGTAGSITTLVGGQTMIGGAHPSDFLPQYKAERIKLIGVATDERDSSMPDVPTLKEQGVDFSAWGSIKGVSVPKNMPDNIKKYYEKLFKQICEDEEFIKIMNDMGQPVMYEDIETFTKTFKNASEDYRNLIDNLGLTYKK